MKELYFVEAVARGHLLHLIQPNKLLASRALSHCYQLFSFKKIERENVDFHVESSDF